MNPRWFKRIKLYFNPPKKGDVYNGDSTFFIGSKYLEAVAHRLVDIEGNHIWDRIPGSDTYKLTIESDVMPYYICKAQCLARGHGGYNYSWRDRSQVRRINKWIFVELILDGTIVKQPKNF